MSHESQGTLKLTMYAIQNYSSIVHFVLSVFLVGHSTTITALPDSPQVLYIHCTDECKRDTCSAGRWIEQRDGL